MDPIVLKQREFYKQHKTLDINFRINALKTLKVDFSLRRQN